MDFRLYIWPRYVLEWQGGRIVFRPPEGAVIAHLVNGQPASLLDLARNLRENTSRDVLLDLSFSIKHIKILLKGSPFQIENLGPRYRFLPKLGKTLDKIADNVLQEDA